VTTEPDTPEFSQLIKQIERFAPAGTFNLHLSSLNATFMPKSDLAAKIEITYEPGYGYYLNVGEGSVFEIPLKGPRYTSAASVADEINLLCQAVFAGRFQEKVTRTSKRIISALGHLEVRELESEFRGRIISDAWAIPNPINFIRSKQTYENKYGPYSTSERSNPSRE